MKKIISLLVSTLLVLGSSVQAFAEAKARASIGSASDYSGGGYYNDTYSPYKDVSPYFWAYDDIVRCSKTGWFSGYPDGSFLPENSITRAEALKVFVEFSGLEVLPIEKSSFYDVDVDKWYAPYIEAAGKDLFPTHSTVQSMNPFQPDMPVAREDTVYALVKTLGCFEKVKYYDGSVLNMFVDKNSISESVKPYFAVAIKEGLVTGYEDQTVRGQEPLNRAEFATLLARASRHGFHKRAPKVSSVVLERDAVELEIGDNYTVSAKATMTDGTNQDYGDFDPYILSGSSVTIQGKTINAVKAGQTKIAFRDEYLGNAILTVTVNALRKVKIKLYDYPDKTYDTAVTVNGSIEYNEPVDLTCNGRDIAVSSDGSFSARIGLKDGENKIEFIAEDKYGVTSSKVIYITKVVPISEDEDTNPTIPEGDECPNDKEHSTENTCDPSQGIDAGSNDNSEPGEKTFYDDGTGQISGDYSADKVISLKSLNSISDKISTSYGSLTDNYGNSYKDYIDCGTHRWGSNKKLQYLLDNRFKLFTATIYVPWAESYNGDGYIQVIADGRVIYTSPKLTKTSRPVDICVNVENCNDLTIQFNSNNICLCLGDAELVKK